MKSVKLKHLVAVLLIGDGVLALVQPEHEAAAWSQSPWLLRQVLRRVEKNPSTTRLVATAQIVTGVWWLVSGHTDKPAESLQ